jgi:hypothetical protein
LKNKNILTKNFLFFSSCCSTNLYLGIRSRRNTGTRWKFSWADPSFDWRLRTNKFHSSCCRTLSYSRTDRYFSRDFDV